MTTQDERTTAPVSSWWRTPVAFVGVSVLATALDVSMTIPPAEERDGHHYLMWGSLDVTTSNVALLMCAVWMALLLNRRRWPLAVVIAVSAASVVLATSSEWAQPISAALVCLYTAARLLTFRPAVVALLAGILPLVARPAVWDDESSLVGYLLGLLLMSSVAIGVWLFGRREHEASETAAVLRQELEVVGHEVAAQERQRIARELHDILAHSVSAMMMQAAGAGALTRRLGEDGPSDPRLTTVFQALSTIEHTGAQSMRELHRLLGALRDDGGGALDLDAPGESGPRPGIGDIEQLAELTRRSGLVVQIHRSGDTVELDPSVRLAGYRVAQESLANAMKHAGRGAVVDIFKSWQPDRLQLQVRSRGGHDGARPGTPGSGTGLVGLRERVELVGGTFEAGWVGEEFVTTAVLPLTAPTSSPAPEAVPAERSRRAENGRPTHIRPVNGSLNGSSDGAA